MKGSGDLTAAAWEPGVVSTLPSEGQFPPFLTAFFSFAWAFLLQKVPAQSSFLELSSVLPRIGVALPWPSKVAPGEHRPPSAALCPGVTQDLSTGSQAPGNKNGSEGPAPSWRRGLTGSTPAWAVKSPPATPGGDFQVGAHHSPFLSLCGVYLLLSSSKDRQSLPLESPQTPSR